MSRLQRWLCRLVGVAVLSGLAGCSLREVRFLVHEPSRVSLATVHTVAVLDFGTPYTSKRYGEEVADLVARTLQERTSPQVLFPLQARSLLAELRITASQFDDPAVVLAAGNRLHADALLYGDVQEASLQRSVEREMVTHKIGERHERVKEVGKDGKVHSVDYAFPVYAEHWRDHVRRTFRVQAVARLVRVSDNSILWQGETHWTQEIKAEEDQDGSRRGDWTPDQEFEQKQLKLAVRAMLADILPRAFSRTRVLALPEQEGPYAEWIQLGNDAALAGDWNLAGSQWLKASSLDSLRPEARGNLGILREHAGDLKQALQDYEFAASKQSKPWGEYARQVRQILEKINH